MNYVSEVGLLPWQRGPWALRGMEGLRETTMGTPRLWPVESQRQWKTGLWEEGHFLPGICLLSLPNRKLVPEKAESGAL